MISALNSIPPSIILLHFVLRNGNGSARVPMELGTEWASSQPSNAENIAIYPISVDVIQFKFFCYANEDQVKMYTASEIIR
jgi:hypothetical protein